MMQSQRKHVYSATRESRLGQRTDSFGRSVMQPSTDPPHFVFIEAPKQLPVDEKDVELVMCQTNASRERAIKALQKHNNDIVEAIIDITVS